MKTLKLTLVAIFLIATASQSFARKEEYKKTISKSFEVNKDAVLAVTNKFGKIHCQNWDKSTISIEVEITVEASSPEKADKYFSKINIDFEGSSSRVSASTHFDDNLFKNNSNNEISVDYNISMPASIGVEMDHKFGDLILGDVEGNSSIDVAYGSLKARKLSGEENDIELKFSEGYIGYVKNAELELKYGELEIDEVVSLSAESKFSSLELGKVDVLTLESGYDDDVIGSVRDLDVEADFSDIEIRNLNERLIADIDYGELKVKEIASGFKLVDIENSFSDANLGFHPEASFRLSATIKMGDLSYPRDRSRLTEVELSYTSNKYEGLIGENNDTSSKVLVEAKNAGVNLFYR